MGTIMFNRLITSRKLWGALLGSACIMILVTITPESSVGNVIAIVGGLWMAAIGGQAVSDALKKKE
jgi:pyruvate/2-oxoacid:ferredoxin oxidoreductase beta subunit